ncbi:MAG: GNAT family N-acetyltransferase [Pseudanabaenaceae cyanobacterium bins.39]|nr:GNAT family N-acetyltransferase [Pseudanabaenaceae cyanobacterium bins.39]
MSSLSPDFTIRPAIATDIPDLFRLITALADYEKLRDQVTGTAETLQEDMFGQKPCIEAIVAEISPSDVSQAQIVGFALFFNNYSTFLTRRGIYLEDLFVLPEYRSRGIGKALISQLAQIAVERGYGRFEWSVLDWNAPAIAFYQKMGAEVLPDWRICRVTGNNLQNLAQMTTLISN